MGSSEQWRGFCCLGVQQPEDNLSNLNCWLPSGWVTHEKSTNTDLRVKLFHFLYKNRAYFPATFTHPALRRWGSLEDWMSSATTVKTPTNVGKRTDLRLCDCHPLHQLKVCSTLNPVWGCSNLSLCWAKSCVGSTRRPDCIVPVAQHLRHTQFQKSATLNVFYFRML